MNRSGSTRILLETDHAIAEDSVDHQHPLGTMQDNSRYPAFTRKLIELYGERLMSVLDIGCSGGGFVKEVLDAGRLAVGLEGSDYSKSRQRAEWATIPDYLFTCDCTKPFQLSFEESGIKRRALFDVVTAWEVLEHIRAEDLPALFKNIIKHLNPETGLFIASVNLQSSEFEGNEYHATLKPEWWWRDMFRKHGFFLIDRALDYFNEDWVRGSKDEALLSTFHIVSALRHDSEIVQKVDHAACSYFEHGRLGVAELRRVAQSALEKANMIEQLVLAQSRSASDFSPSHLRVLAAQAIARCRAEGWSKIALYGAGSHSSVLAQLWEEFAGPAIVAVIVSRRDLVEFRGVPVCEAGEKLPAGVQAIVPSSHRDEAAMRRTAKELYPELPWVFLWDPVF
jgi:hypothetical protein